MTSANLGPTVQLYLKVLPVAIALLMGCRPAGPLTYPVTGIVTLDEEPVERGEIIFTPEDRRIGPEFGEIINGKCRCRAKAGKQQVQITASHEVPGTQGQGFRGTSLIENYIPPQYNSATVLSVEVSPDGDNRFEFKLESGRRTSKQP